MRALVSADWHLGSYATGPHVNGVNDRINDLAKQVMVMRDHAIRNKIGWLIIAGDLFKNRRPDNLYLSAMAEFFHAFRSVGIQVLVITGNHDVHLVEGQAHALSVFRSMNVPGIHVFDAPTAMAVEGVNILFFPYCGAPQDGKLREAIAKFPNCEVLVMHGSVEGAIMSQHSEFEIHDSDEVKAETLSGFRLVIAGHLHHCHNVGNVWYPGSIEQLTFDDEGVDKMFLDVTIQDGQVAVTKVPLDHRTVQTLTYAQFPDVIAGTLDVKGKVIRMVDVDEHHLIDVARILREKGCYHVAGVHRELPERIPVEKLDARKLDAGTFVREFARASKYEGDVEAAVRTVAALLDS
jgi:DNA repair exonuclease SbcCD nuclease subunit